MAWLVKDARVLASVEVADTFAARCRGLLGRDGIDGALLLRPARSVHTLGMRFAIDVAHCDGDLKVLHVTRMRPHRIGRPFRQAYVIIEAEAGAFERWGLRVGDELALHGEEAGPPGAGPSSRRLPTVGRRLKVWGTHRSPVSSTAPVGVGSGGRDAAPLVGITSRASTPGAPSVRSVQSVLCVQSVPSVGCRDAESAVVPSPARSSSPPPRGARRVRLPVACW
ncbi:MAG: DUF192 domain-containing protein [Acidimicrobiales bacterium]